MSSFYELTADWRRTEDRLEAGEITVDQAIAELSQTGGEALIKCGNVAGWIKSLDALVDARKSEIDRLRDRNRETENLITGLKKLLMMWLKATGEKTVKTHLGNITLRKPSTQLVVDESKVEEWPAEMFDAAEDSGALQRVYKVNKTELKRLEGYLTLPGVCELEGEESLMIR